MYQEPPYCECILPRSRVHKVGDVDVLKCTCGEKDFENQISWRWKVNEEHGYVSDGLNVTFHPVFSAGTSIVRGEHQLKVNCIHYWEVKILTELSGTDQMIGVGNADVSLTKYQDSYISALGCDDNSWAFSYRGLIHYEGQSTIYGNKFNKGCIVGVAVDMSLGYIEFFLNRRSLGVAFRNIPKDKPIYPMMCSTASKSSFRLITSTFFEDSLSYRSYEAMAKNGLTKMLNDVPGLQLQITKYWYLIPRSYNKQKDNEISIEDEIILLKTMSTGKQVISQDNDSDENFDLYADAFIPPAPTKNANVDEEDEENIFHLML